MEKNNKQKTAVALLLLITVAAVAITVWALFFRDGGGKIVLSPDYAPMEEESFAEVIGDDDGSKLTVPEGGGAVSLIYQKTATVDLSEGTVSLLFGNPAKSNQNVIVQLVIQENIIVQSGLIVPGNKVTKLDLLEGKEEILKAGGYEGKLKVLYYDPVTGEKAMLNTEIPLDITVRE